MDNASEAQEGAPVAPIVNPLDSAQGVFIAVEDFKLLYAIASKLEYGLAIKIMPFLERARVVKSVQDEAKS
jgi:hypothetical protein